MLRVAASLRSCPFTKVLPYGGARASYADGYWGQEHSSNRRSKAKTFKWKCAKRQCGSLFLLYCIGYPRWDCNLITKGFRELQGNSNECFWFRPVHWEGHNVGVEFIPTSHMLVILKNPKKNVVLNIALQVTRVTFMKQKLSKWHC